MIEIYRQGLADGRDPKRFSKIGDCQNVDTLFLGAFDNPNDYVLGGQYQYLQPTIDHFAGSWSRKSLAVKGGMNVAAVLTPLRADPTKCNTYESPLACEIRIYNPSIVTVSMEEVWSGDTKKYDRYMRQIVEYILSQGVVPILATKADNLEGDNSVNAAIAQIAYDYQIPLWNFWAAVQPLPQHGLSEDGFHLTLARNIFDDPVRMKNAWPWRNLTALQSFDAVYQAVNVAHIPTATPIPVPTLNPADWQSWPVVPSVSVEMITVYQRGQELGNDPRAFSKIGDGEISATWFFTNFDLGHYNLGPYVELRPVIDEFFGSFDRVSQAAHSGFTTTLILDPKAADKYACKSGESPMDCELRLHKPSFAFISLGTNQIDTPEVFESELRQILEHLLEKGVVPILSTKADNLEGDHRINQIIAHLAVEYHVPLWNFWLAVQPLPNHGLQDDMEHLTYAGLDFSNNINMQSAWPWRNLTALQSIDAVYYGLKNAKP
jgi:hypothetical protein